MSEVKYRTDYNELIGQRFERLTVLSFVCAGKSAKYKVKCDCGKEKIVCRSSLLSRNTKSCGCLSIEVANTRAKDSAFNKVLWNYKLNSKKRNIEFNLTTSEFKELTKNNCYYCKVEPSMIQHAGKYQESYVYNGVDRKNNNLGYTIDNCVACCRTCNMAKGEKSLEDFYKWIERLKSVN